MHAFIVSEVKLQHVVNLTIVFYSSLMPVLIFVWLNFRPACLRPLCSIVQLLSSVTACCLVLLSVVAFVNSCNKAHYYYYLPFYCTSRLYLYCLKLHVCTAFYSPNTVMRQPYFCHLMLKCYPKILILFKKTAFLKKSFVIKFPVTTV